MASAIKLVIAGILCALLLGGCYDHIFNIEPNKCHMTYMFEYPEFITVVFPSSVQKLFPHYNLYSYGEGNYSKILRKGHYEGIPVLFIPGNGGSYKQVRSLASVAYRKALDDETDYHFNFFTVDLDEELVGFYGPLLKKQTEFVTHAVKQILKLYENNEIKPKSVILVGHSMGGMVARAVLANEDVAASTLPLIITQATPHTRPVVTVDYHLKEFYEQVNDYWGNERESRLKDPILITIGAGRNDIQVSTSHVITPFADIATTTGNVPSCWLTTDHQAIVWCKQLVMAIVRSLFDIVDPLTEQITTDRKFIQDVFEYHLSKRIAGKRYRRHAIYASEVSVEDDGHWIEITKRQDTYIAKETKKNTYLEIPLKSGHHLYHDMTIVAANLNKKDWVMACKIGTQINKKTCLEAINLSQKTKKLHGKVKSVQLELENLYEDGYTSVVVNVPPTEEKVEVSVDVHSQTGRHRSVEVPAFIRSFTQTLIVDTTPQNALTYNISLVGLQEPWQSFRFMLRPRQTCEKQDVVVAKIYMPWADKETYLQKTGQVVSFSAELDLPPPAGDTSNASIQFFLNPGCQYSVRLQGSLVGVFRRLIGLYGTQIPVYCVVHLLLALSRQLKTVGEESYCPSFYSALLTLTPISIVPFVKITSLILVNIDILDDFTVMTSYGEDLQVLPVLLFFGALPITICLGMAIWAAILLSGNATHTFAVKILGRSIGGGELVGDLAMSGLSRIPFIVGVAFISLSYTTCGTLGLILSSIFYFIKIFKMYEDYIEQFIIGLIPGVKCDENAKKTTLSSIHIHVTLLLLMIFVALFNSPALIIWGQAVRHHLQLEEDTSLGVTVILLVNFCLLWQKEIPSLNRDYCKHLAHVIHAIAVMTVLFGSIHIYRVSYFVTATITLLTLHQILAPKKAPVSIEPPTNENQTSTQVEEIDREDVFS